MTPPTTHSSSSSVCVTTCNIVQPLGALLCVHVCCGCGGPQHSLFLFFWSGNDFAEVIAKHSVALRHVTLSHLELADLEDLPFSALKDVVMAVARNCPQLEELTCKCLVLVM